MERFAIKAGLRSNWTKGTPTNTSTLEATILPAKNWKPKLHVQYILTNIEQ